MRRVAWAAALLVTMTAAGCGRPAKQAAPDVHAFLTAVQARDEAAFEAGLDRDALRAQLRDQLVELSRANGVEVEGGPSEFVLDRMITPENIQLVGDAGSPADLRRLLKKVDAQSVCVPDRTPEQRCLLTFRREKAGKGGSKATSKAGSKAGWRLVAMPATQVAIDITPPTKDGANKG